MKNAFRSLLSGCLLFFLTVVPSLPAIADAPSDKPMYQQAGSRTLVASHQKDEVVDCEEAASGNNVSVGGKAAPEQENASQEGQTGEKSTARCPQDTERREGLLHRILRFFVTPAPSRPNLDVDTNISAGGAGGG